MCKSSVELVIKIQEFKDLEPRGSGPSSLRLSGRRSPAEPQLAAMGRSLDFAEIRTRELVSEFESQALGSGRWRLEFQLCATWGYPVHVGKLKKKNPKNKTPQKQCAFQP